MSNDEYGDFEEVVDGEQQPEADGEQQVSRVRLPKGDNQFIGMVVNRLGGNKMDIKCSDGKNRNCRVPGRFRRKFWLRPGDFVIVELWELDKDKADIIHQYRKGPQVDRLRKMGKLDNLKDEF